MEKLSTKLVNMGRWISLLYICLFSVYVNKWWKPLKNVVNVGRWIALLDIYLCIRLCVNRWWKLFKRLWMRVVRLLYWMYVCVFVCVWTGGENPLINSECGSLDHFIGCMSVCPFICKYSILKFYMLWMWITNVTS